MAEEFFLAACSPRRGGNSDFAASLLQQALPGRSTLRRVADCGVRPCISCGFCGENPGRCALDGPEDGAAALFDEMLRARFCIVVSPVYFYHIPAQAKAWVDRAQRFWACAERPGKGGILSAVLFGARPRGEKLFEGAERTLRYMALTLGMQWRAPLCLYGLDGPYELAGSEQSRERIREYARTFAGEKR
ncbi:flavodoxin family protein [Mailhella massiliensis]|uniref:flavodoxin family protein n=1 Tax=Mailhella massiliensis TaxID=1903261 RepID=UPI002353BD2D|nr:NAD(P)H-dependent oxidoreductase [Mailhella massiliensis]